MRRVRLSGAARVCVVVALAVTAAVAQESADQDRFWPQWRGPLGTGVAPHGEPPFSVTTAIASKTRSPLVTAVNAAIRSAHMVDP